MLLKPFACFGDGLQANVALLDLSRDVRLRFVGFSSGGALRALQQRVDLGLQFRPPVAYSGPKAPPIPLQTRHRFRCDPATSVDVFAAPVSSTEVATQVPVKLLVVGTYSAATGRRMLTAESRSAERLGPVVRRSSVNWLYRPRAVLGDARLTAAERSFDAAIVRRSQTGRLPNPAHHRL